MNRRNCDLIYRIIIVLGLEYLLFFSLESILPGLVVRVFNINILLLLLVGFIVSLLFDKTKCLGVFSRKDGESEDSNKSTKELLFWKYFLMILVSFLILVILIILHKVSFLLILGYLIGILFLATVLWLNG
jgi:hypothetical protein